MWFKRFISTALFLGIVSSTTTTVIPHSEEHVATTITYSATTKIETSTGIPETIPVTIFGNETVDFYDLGCWKERRSRTIILSVELILTPIYGDYQTRNRSIEICASYAKSKGYKVFALQRGGLCITSENEHITFDKYGISRACKDDGKGAQWANQVYRIGILNTEVTYASIGCYRDNNTRAIQKVDGLYDILDGHFRERTNATKKCAIVASALGYTVFAVQNGGWCATAVDAHLTYDKYGASTDCKEDGEGGVWASEIYSLNGWKPETKRYAFSYDSNLCFDNVSTCAQQAERVLQQYCQDVDDVICNTYKLVDFDECEFANGETEDNNCSVNARCVNNYGSYTCVCESPYVDLDPTIPGRNCSEI